MHVFLVVAGIDYEGDTVLFVGSSKESAREFLDKNFEEKPNPIYKYSTIWVPRDTGDFKYGSYDDMTIVEWEVDAA